MEMASMDFVNLQLNLNTIIVLVLMVNLCGKWNKLITEEKKLVKKSNELISQCVDQLKDKHVICVSMCMCACVSVWAGKSIGCH